MVHKVFRWTCDSKPDDTKQKTVKVRIPVAVDEHGNWATGASNAFVDARNWHWTNDTYRGHNDIGCSPRIVWITAEVPIPEPVEVEGMVGE